MTNEEDLIQKTEPPNFFNSNLQTKISNLLENENQIPNQPESKENIPIANSDSDDDILSDSPPPPYSNVDENNFLNTIVPNFANPDEKPEEPNKAIITDESGVSNNKSLNNDKEQLSPIKNQAPLPISEISLMANKIISNASNGPNKTDNNTNPSIPENPNSRQIASTNDLSKSNVNQEHIENTNTQQYSVSNYTNIETEDTIESILNSLQQKTGPKNEIPSNTASKSVHNQNADTKTEPIRRQISIMDEPDNSNAKHQSFTTQNSGNTNLNFGSQNYSQPTEYPKPVVPVISISNGLTSNQSKTTPFTKKSTTNTKTFTNTRLFNPQNNSRAKSSPDNPKRNGNNVTSSSRNTKNSQADSNKPQRKSRSVIRQRSPSPSEAPSQPMSSLCITPGDLQELLANNDEPELELNEQTTEALESFKKTGRLRFALLDGASEGESGNGGRFSPKIIRKLQRDKVNAILTGNYDDAKEADDLSKKFSNAVIESHEEDKRFDRLRSAEWKLAEEKQAFATFHQEWVEKVKDEEACLVVRMNALKEVHDAEMQQLEEKWNSEEFLRKFTKPSAGLLELKAVERSMVIAKMFDKAKQVRERAEQLQKIESKEQQKRATEEMKIERKRLRERQKRETQTLQEKCDQILLVVKKTMQKEESPYKARIEKLEKLVADLKSGNDNRGKTIVPSMVQANAVSSPRAKGNELVTARTAFKLSAYKATAQSMKLNIKPLGCISKKTKKRSVVTKVEKP